MSEFRLNALRPLQDRPEQVIDVIGGLKVATTVELPAGDVQTQINSKVSSVVGKQLSDENFTLPEKNKLAGLEKSLFVGRYLTLSALSQANLSPQREGSYGYVDAGSGDEETIAIWDTTDALWVEAAGKVITPVDAKALYEANPDTECLTTDGLATVNNIDSELALHTSNMALHLNPSVAQREALDSSNDPSGGNPFVTTSAMTTYSPKKIPTENHIAAANPHSDSASDAEFYTHVNASNPHSDSADKDVLSQHTADPNPHSNSAAKSDLTIHANASNPHSSSASSYELDTHANASNPHSGSASSSELSTHANASNPHSNSAEKSVLSQHTADPNPHSGSASSSELSTHVNASNPHPGSVSSSELSTHTGDTGVHVTPNQSNALNASKNPSSTNAYATIADLSGLYLAIGLSCNDYMTSRSGETAYAYAKVTIPPGVFIPSGSAITWDFGTASPKSITTNDGDDHYYSDAWVYPDTIADIFNDESYPIDVWIKYGQVHLEYGNFGGTGTGGSTGTSDRHHEVDYGYEDGGNWRSGTFTFMVTNGQCQIKKQL